MNSLIEYLLQFDTLNQEQISQISRLTKEVELQKEEYFSQAGKVARQVGFLVEGIMRVCYYNNKGQEITRYFIEEANFVVDLASFQNQIPSSEYVQAITNCKLIVLTQGSLTELSNTIIGWDSIVHKIASKALLQKIERISPLVAEDATTRYLVFMQKYPALMNRIPLAYLASYLGITQSSLSRIRKNIR